MAKQETVLAHTVTPGKQATPVNRDKYDIIASAITSVLKSRDEVVFRDLPGLVRRQLAQPFDGSVSWYTTTVKLDLEYRGIIERVEGSKPQRLRMVTRRSNSRQ